MEIRIATKYEVEKGEQAAVVMHGTLDPGLKDNLVREGKVNIFRVKPDRF
jgi:hypothetical protein